MTIVNTKRRAVIARRQKAVAALRLKGLSVREIVDELPKLDPPIINEKDGKSWARSTVSKDIIDLEDEWRADAAGDMAVHKQNVIDRLTEQAMSEWAPYIVVQGGRPGIDVQKMLNDGKAYLIQGIRYTKAGDPIIEFPNSQSALVNLGKIYGLYVERQEVSGSDGQPIKFIRVVKPENAE